MSGESSAKDPYYNALTDASDTIENLVHSLAFEKMMANNATETIVRATAPELLMTRADLPASILEKQYFPVVIEMENLVITYNTVYTSDEDTKDETAERDSEWNLVFGFSYGTSDVQVVSNATQTVVSMRGPHNDQLAYSVESSAGPRLLVAIAANALQQDSESFIDVVPEETLLAPATINTMLSLIGNRAGQYKKTAIANLAHPEYPKRSLIIAANEVETTTISGQNIELRLACELAPDKFTAMDSYQSETVGENTLQHRYGKRYPTDVAPDQLYYAIQLGMVDDSEGVFLNPYADREQYDLVSTAVMTVLKHHLAPYERFDKIDRSDLRED